MHSLKEGDNVLIIANDATSTEDIKRKITKNVEITSTSVSRIQNIETKSFDFIICKDQLEAIISDSVLPKVLTLLKPGGIFAVADTISNIPKIEFELKVNGFVNIKQNDGVLYCSKPNYELGSSTKLNLKAKPAKAVWKIDDTIEDDMIDPDNLLDEDDLIKPDSSSLRVCATTGKRKACKDCSCGLAEELTGETKANTVNSENAKSSCGNCYLGDAFRCAACPYLGMPAFKPGEKVQLAGNLLKSDI
ncbi:hypothetical protein AMK59_5422 [Oryctes borbonicus]|uniref:Anamorsin homolog n=1 Tax=Oryctes borbonicus TaxID=1629725 RepID=A0A0T6B1T1_9SCAR|nr:hypothetical protein AMK59_5422 [Oryctes borbonicus]